MTIIEAIKSGKAFKREKNVYWLVLNKAQDLVRFEDFGGYECDFHASDILADDWIVREE